MSQVGWWCCGRPLRIAIALGIGGAIALQTRLALAQITPDITLGNESSIVIPNANVRGFPADSIEGGATRGNNLFHSFQEFNVRNGQRLYFANPEGIENILTRVTGNNLSNILGTLGVDGGANLFLLNANGILFGENAQLDITGSFVASTANSIVFGNGTEFSATNPEAPPLLTISLTPGLQYGMNQARATIANSGHLAVGQNLTLAAGNLDLQGQLSAGGDLTLLAQDTVRIRDSLSHPFIASSVGKLLVQGNQEVDIFALNHADSGFFSAGDMVLRSANTVGGDAHYWSAGSFRLEKLDGNLGNLSSPYDPIILAAGNVSLGDYAGASLHILAGGSVTLGNVEITATDSGENTINPNNPNPFLASLASVLLSDRTTLTIDGSAKPTLDVRAGVDWTTLLGGVPSDVTIGTVTPPPTFGGVTRANITVNGDIRVSEADGVVLLTNQYQPNNLTGNISTQGIDTSTNLSASNGGLITIDSRGSINTGNLSSFSGVTNGNAGDGGAIALFATSNIITEQLSSFSDSSAFTSNAGNGGAIALTAGGNITTGELVADASADSFNESSAGDGGTIALTASGNIITEDVSSSSDAFSAASESSTGNGGTISFLAEGDITTGQLSSTTSSSFSSNGTTTGNAGTIALTAGSNITTQEVFSYSYASSNSESNAGSGGAINFFANGNISLGEIASDSVSVSGFSPSNTGNGGAITLSAGGNITTVKISSDSDSFSSFSSTTAGDGGAIALTAGGNITTGQLSSSSNGDSFFLFSSSTGSGGAIAMLAGGNITADNLITSSQNERGDITLVAQNNISSTGFIDASGGGDGGNISLTSQLGEVSLENSLITSNVSGSGSGGTIRIEAESVALTNTDLTTTSSGDGNAGEVLINGRQSVSLNNGRLSTALEAGAIGSGGNVSVESNAGWISLLDFTIDTATFGQGDAGNVVIKANDFIAFTRSAIFSITNGPENAGKVTVEAGDVLSLTDGSTISTAVDLQGVGNGGDIDINARSMSLTGGSQLQALTRGIGESGNIQIDVSDSITISGIGSDGFLSAVLTSSDEPNSGRGGNIEINTLGNLLVFDGAVLSAQTSSAADGGNISVNANNLTLRSGGQLLTNTFSQGRAGNITVNATDSVVITGVDLNFDQRVPPRPLLRDEAPVVNPPVTQTALDSNNSINTAQEINNFFSIDSLDNPNSDVEFSTRIPYVSLIKERTQLNLDSFDYYSFEVTTAGTRIIVDIDSTSNGFDTALSLFDSQGNELTSNDNAPSRLGAGGSNSTSLIGAGGSFVLTETDSYLRYVFSEPGHYFIQVSGSEEGNIVPITTGENYTLQVSLDTPKVASSIVNSGTSVAASGLFARSEGAGAAGDVKINTPELLVQEAAQVSASTSDIGTGGSVQVNASESVFLNKQGSLLTESSGAGLAGDLTIDTRQLILQEGSKISASTLLSQGGSVTLQDLETLQVNDSLISASTQTGIAGNLTVTASESVQLSGVGGLSVEATDGGTAGSLTVETGQMSVQDEARVTVSSPSGQAGNLTITADTLFLNRGTISAETGESDLEGGANITLQGLDLLRMENESLISANALGTSNGGNVTIDSTFIVAIPPTGIEGSDIVANAVEGNGGRVSITTQGLFGIEFRSQRTPLNDITVSSEFGIAGVFEQTTPGVDPSRGLAELPTDVVDASRQIDRRCTATEGTEERGSFTITGRGGLPPSPNNTLQGESVVTNWVALDSNVESNNSQATTSSSESMSRQTVEAQGWVVNEKGQVVLTAASPIVTPQGEWLNPAKCNALQNTTIPQS